MRKGILKRAGIEDLTVRIAPVSFGSGIAPAVDHRVTEEIDLTWQPNNASMSSRTTFYVVEEGAFDLLVDNNFIREHDALNNNRSMLFLKNKRRDSGRSIKASLQPIDADFEKPRGIDKQKGERNDELKRRVLKRNGKDLSKNLEHSVGGRSKATQIWHLQRPRQRSLVISGRAPRTVRIRDMIADRHSYRIAKSAVALLTATV